MRLNDLDGAARSGRAAAVAALRATPPAVAPGMPLCVGEALRFDDADAGDCPAVVPFLLGLPFPGACVLDAGHAGPHVAGDGEIVLAVW